MAKMTKAQALKRLKEARRKISAVVDAGHLSFKDAAQVEMLIGKLHSKIYRK